MATQAVEHETDRDPVYEEAAPASMDGSYFMAEDPEDEVRPRGRRIVWTAAILSIVWLAAAAAVIYLLVDSAALGGIGLTGWAGISAGIFAPLTALWLAALVIARVDPGRGQRELADIEAAEARFQAAAAAAEQRVGGIELMLAAVGERLDLVAAQMNEHGAAFEAATGRAAESARTVSGSLAEDRERLDAAVARLAERGDHAHGRFAELAETLPQTEAQAQRLGEAIATYAQDARERAAETEQLIQALEARGKAADQAARERGADTEALLTHIDRTARDVEAMMQERGGALRTEIEEALSAAAGTLQQVRADFRHEVDGALNRSSDSLEHARAALTAQAEALTATIENANTALDETGRRAAMEIAERLETLIGHTGELGRAFDEQESHAAALFEKADVRAQEFGARLGALRQESDSVVEALLGRIAEAHSRAAGVETPLQDARALATETSDRIDEARGSLEAALQALSAQVPGEAAASLQTVAALREELTAVGGEMEALRGRADGLSGPVNEVGGSIQRSVAELDRARTELAAVAETIEGDFEKARALVAETQRTAEDGAIGAAAQLIETLGRVREMAGQAARSVHEMLNNVVDDAVTSLGRAGEEAVRTSIAEPVADQVERIEEVGARSAAAAEAAAERLSRSLVSVAETAAAVEARVAEANQHLDTAQRRDLSQQSNLLMEALNSNAIDITKALSTEVTEAAWKQYLAGDRSVFTRRASRLVETSAAKEIARQYEEEPEFREAVRRYIHDFEAMLRRIMQDREGNALSVALLSSDVGRLYVALAQGTDRLRGKE